jgi:hypothetical protein
LLNGCRSPQETGSAAVENFSFVAAGDMRSYITGAPVGKRYFDGLCEAAHEIGGGEFMLSPGDCDAPSAIRSAIDQFLGTNYLWYPVVGNHDVGSNADMAWLRNWTSNGIPHLVRSGPGGSAFTYSFDFGNSHFVAVGEYEGRNPQKVGKADISDVMLDWLEEDLAATRKPLIWVFGHNPIKSLPDMDTGRLRHATDSISTNAARCDRFVEILTRHKVRGYICGHTHNTSVAKVAGIWQADSGHARGAGDPGSPSTFLKFRITGRQAVVDVYRADPAGINYTLRETIVLD